VLQKDANCFILLHMPRQRALTVRLDADQYDRLAATARTENRTPTNYVETLLLRDLAAKDESARILRMYIAPEAKDVIPGEVERIAGESDEEHAERSKLFRDLMSLPDED
jgi:hypothetical protein